MVTRVLGHLTLPIDVSIGMWALGCGGDVASTQMLFSPPILLPSYSISFPLNIFLTHTLSQKLPFPLSLSL
jgi:hypothetical protein